MAHREDRELEPLAPLDPMLAAPEVFAPLRDEGPSPDESPVTDAPRPAEPAALRPHRRLRRGLAAAAAGLVALAVAGVVTQNVLDGRAAHHAAETFSSFEAADYLLGQQTAAIDSRMVPDDQPRVDRVLARAEQAAIADDTRALRTLQQPFWLGSSTHHLIGSVRAALEARIADLQALVAWRSRPVQSRGPQPRDPSAASKALLDKATVAAAKHVSKPPAGPAPATATNDLAALLGLSNFTDRPTGSTLAVADAGGVALVDVDASASVNLNFAGTAETVVGRNGYIAAITRDGVALAKAPNGDALPTFLGQAQEVLPAAEPYGVWLVQPVRDRRFTPARTQVTEVDGTGQSIVGPVSIPAGQYVTGGVTAAGLVLSAGDQGLLLWDARTGQERALTPAGATLLAAAPGVIAWQGDGESPVYMTDVRSGATRTITLPAHDVIVADLDVASTTCAFSPDASQLACPLLDMQALPGAPFRLGVIDVVEGNVRVLAGAASTSDAHPIVWSPDGSRVWSVVATTEGSLLATWGSGQPTAQEVRYHVGNWLVGLAVLEQQPQGQ